MAEDGCKLGVLAFGDSITNGGGELQWGVALQSWALWLARALGLPFTNYATDGARVEDVVHEQIPAFRHRSVRPDARYDIGCLYIGVNDVRDPGFDADDFAPRFGEAIGFLESRCDRTIALTTPLWLGVPRTPEDRIRALNEVVRRRAPQVVDLSDFRARNHVMADRVHPSAFGQIAIAERALKALGDAPSTPPSSLIAYETTRWKRLRGDATYTYRALKAALPPR